MSEGIKIGPSKTEAITEIPEPRSVNELQRFLGTVNYLGKFNPDLVKHTTLLRHLLKKDVVLELQKPQLDTIVNLKTLVTAGCSRELYGTANKGYAQKEKKTLSTVFGI